MKKLLSRRINPAVILLAAALTGCGREVPKKEYVVKVNDSYLTAAEYSELADSVNNISGSEIIRNWIDQELLYQEAVRKGIIDENYYKVLTENSRKNLAGALLLKRIYEQNEFIYELKEIEDYFANHNDEFRLPEDSYLLNIAEFMNEDDAIKFRSAVLTKGWEIASEEIRIDTILSNSTGLFLTEEEVYPRVLRRVIPELLPQEVSTVIAEEDKNFIIAQLIEKFGTGTIPPFEFIRNKVENRFLALKKEQFIKKYMEQLYSENDIEIKENK